MSTNGNSRQRSGLVKSLLGRLPGLVKMGEPSAAVAVLDPPDELRDLVGGLLAAPGLPDAEHESVAGPKGTNYSSDYFWLTINTQEGKEPQPHHGSWRLDSVTTVVPAQGDVPKLTLRVVTISHDDMPYFVLQGRRTGDRGKGKSEAAAAFGDLKLQHTCTDLTGSEIGLVTYAWGADGMKVIVNNSVNEAMNEAMRQRAESSGDPYDNNTRDTVLASNTLAVLRLVPGVTQ